MKIRYFRYIGEVRGIILFTIVRRKLVVGCAPCLNKKLLIASGSNIAMGIGALFHMIHPLFINLGNFRSVKQQTHNNHLRNYVAQKKGTLAMMSDKDFDWPEMDHSAGA